MKMKTALVTLICAAPSLCAVAGWDDAMKTACATGFPWRLPATLYAETPISLSNNNRVVIICNCTEASDQSDAGVWVLTLPPVEAARFKRLRAPAIAPPEGVKADEPKPGPGQTVDYLPGLTCTAVGTGSVTLRTADHRGVKWGTWQLEPK